MEIAGRPRGPVTVPPLAARVAGEASLVPAYGVAPDWDRIRHYHALWDAT